MKIELPGGRKFDLPDSLTDAQVDSIARALISAEQSAAAAQGQVAALADSIKLLVAKLSEPKAEQDDTELIAAVVSLRAGMEAGFAKMLQAQLADTVLVRDEVGEIVRSKKVKREQ